MILGRATIRHFNAMVRYFSTKSAIPTIHMRSKKSSLSRLGFRNIRLKGTTTRLKYQWGEPHFSFLLWVVSTAGQRKAGNSTELQWSSQRQQEWDMQISPMVHLGLLTLSVLAHFYWGQQVCPLPENRTQTRTESVLEDCNLHNLQSIL